MNDERRPGGLDRRDFLLTTASLMGAATALPASAAEHSAPALPAPSDGLPLALITGANRGLGLQFTRRYLAQGWRVIATCRSPDEADALRALNVDGAALVIEALDVTNHLQIDRLAALLEAWPIDLLLNNAGIGGATTDQLFGRLNYPVFDQLMAVNALGPIKMAEAFQKHVRASGQKKIITVSSSQGSIASVEAPMLYWYRASKAALNMLMVNLSLQVKRRGVIVGLVTPGATATDFIAPEFRKRIPNIREPGQAAEDMMRNIERFTLENSGTFFDYDGSVIPW
jgi:NAD(P)-dependent dehydrogenase (short-subunit alcohol dehydrogenase family)